MKILKDSLIYLLGEMLSKAVPFFLLPYLSRKLGVEGYGELSYFQTILALFIIFVGLSQDGAVARYFYRYGKHSLGLVINAGYLYTLIIGSVFLIIFFILKSQILVYIVLASIFQVFLSVQLSVKQFQKKSVSYISIQFSTIIITTLFTIIAFEIFNSELVEKRFLSVLLGNSLVFFVVYFFFFERNVKEYSFKLYKKAFIYFLAFGIPMLLHHGSIFVKGQMDRVFIYHKFSEFDLGLYAVGAQIANILSILILALNKALVPYLFENLKNGRFSLKLLHKLAFLSLLAVPIPAIIVFFIPESFFLWILGSEFVGVKYYIMIFSFSTTLVIPYLFLVNYLFYHGKTKIISFASILSTIVYFLMLVYLVSLSDIKYVSYASIIGNLSIIPILYFFTRRA